MPSIGLLRAMLAVVFLTPGPGGRFIASDPLRPLEAATGTGGVARALERQGSQAEGAAANPTALTVAEGLPKSHRPPLPGLSQYITSTSEPVLSRAGCVMGKQAQQYPNLGDAIVVLDFGRPLHRGHLFGTSLFGKGFRSTSSIGSAVEAYAQGYSECSRGVPNAHLQLAVGTSNYGRYGPRVSYWHGRAWGAMVNATAEWVRVHGYGDRVGIAGANDIELGWNGPSLTRRWVQGYGSTAGFPYYDYGDAAGCPPRGTCIGGWTVEDVWYVAWGAPRALPLPEIYAPNGSSAHEWQRLSLYAYTHHGSRLHIAGVMSQHRACWQSSDPCWGMNNSPSRAYSLLWTALNADPRTAQDLRWSTDVLWNR